MKLLWMVPLLASFQAMCPASSAQSLDVNAVSSGNVIAVNPVTNKIYTGNETVPYVTVIDGATNDRAEISIGGIPGPIAVNPVTNKIYVCFLAALGGRAVAIIDGATNQVTKVAVPASPYGLAVNPKTNKIYIANYYGGKMTVIDGSTNTTAIISTGLNPVNAAVNPPANQIYLANWDSTQATIIDGRHIGPVKSSSQEQAKAIPSLSTASQIRFISPLMPEVSR